VVLTEARYTDVMVEVDSLGSSLRFWQDALGFHPLETGKDWVTLEDRRTGQRITLVEASLGTPWAMAVAAPDLDEAARKFEAGGGVIEERCRAEGGAYCRGRTPDGVSILFYRS
jgi:catechol 2,3-dioxygenase-like lactoylglutathione lyase family enzyme